MSRDQTGNNDELSRFAFSSITNKRSNQQMIHFFTIAVLFITISSIASCSIYCPAGSNSFGSSILRSKTVVRAWIHKDISPPVDPFMPWGTRYYRGRVAEIFKGHQQNIKEGRIIFAGGACGSSLPVKTKVLLFGEVQLRLLDKYAAPVSVFVPTSCTSTYAWRSLTDQQIDRVRNIGSEKSSPCHSVDCAELIHPPTETVKCSNGTIATTNATCAPLSGQCGWLVDSPPSC